MTQQMALSFCSICVSMYCSAKDPLQYAGVEPSSTKRERGSLLAVRPPSICASTAGIRNEQMKQKDEKNV